MPCISIEEQQMETLAVGKMRKSWLKAISNWWSDRAERQRALRELWELKCCSEGDFRNIATESGLCAADMRKLVARGPAAANLLFRRMTAIDLDRSEVSRVEPAVFRDLQKNCALCDSRRRCLSDLARKPNDPIWEKYCPNASTLKALNAMPWVSRNEW
jgi:hypothetical protein